MSSSSKSGLPALTPGAIGVVFGDIGTSPLYAVKEVFHESHGIGLNEAKMMETSFFLNRESLFAWMNHSASTAMEFFKLPPNRVIELGTQVEI